MCVLYIGDDAPGDPEGGGGVSMPLNGERAEMQQQEEEEARGVMHFSPPPPPPIEFHRYKLIFIAFGKPPSISRFAGLRGE